MKKDEFSLETKGVFEKIFHKKKSNKAKARQVNISDEFRDGSSVVLNANQKKKWKLGNLYPFKTSEKSKKEKEKEENEKVVRMLAQSRGDRRTRPNLVLEPMKEVPEEHEQSDVTLLIQTSDTSHHGRCFSINSFFHIFC